MKRQILVVLVGLAAAGCAQTLPVKPQPANGSGDSPPTAQAAEPGTATAAHAEKTPDPAKPEPATGAPAPALVPYPIPSTSTVPAGPLVQIAGAPGAVNPRSVKLPPALSDPLLGADPEVVLTPASAPSQAPAPEAAQPAVTLPAESLPGETAK